MCLSLDVGSIYAPVAFWRLYLCTARLCVCISPAMWTGLGANYESRAIPTVSQHG